MRSNAGHDRRSRSIAFSPDYGRVAHYRSASGMGMRLDAGTAFSGAMVTPFYDSLLVKVTASGPPVRRRGRAAWNAACRNSASAA